MSDKAQVIIVKNAAHDGYRRAGVRFSQGETRLKVSDVTDTQLAQLKVDPRLAVVVEHQNTADTDSDTPGNMGNGENELPLAEAIMKLDPDNEEHFTKGHKPELKALSELLGRNVTAAERDEVWAAMQEAAEQGE